MIGSALLLVFLTVSSPAQPLVVQTDDGLCLEWSQQGHVVGCRLGERILPLRAPGGFSVVDYRNQPTPLNLVANGGFEEGSRGWSLEQGQEIDRTVVHSGEASVRLSVPGPTPASSDVGQVVDVKPGRRYRCGIWMRREKVGVCGAYVSELDSAGKLCGKASQIGLPVPKDDDVWRFAHREIETGPRTAKLRLRGNIYRSTGVLWLDEFVIEELSNPVSQPFVGAVQRDGAEVRFQAAAPGADLQLQAAFSVVGDSIRADGQLKDLSGQDRAVGLRFELPMDAAGWTWWDELEERRTIDAPMAYRHTYACESGEGVCSIYPWSALSGPLGGLSLALPLAQGPRVFVIEYDPGRRVFSVAFFLGLSPRTAKFPGRATFSFVLYRHDPAWGMRSAAARYYALFPDSFQKRPVYEGYLNYADMERVDPKTRRLNISSGGRLVDDASDFGEGYLFLGHLHGCYDFRMYHTERKELPSDAEVLGFLRGLVKQEQSSPRSYCPTAETIKKLVYDAEGGIRYIGDSQYFQPHEGYNRTDKPGWGLNFRVNEDPEISAAVAQGFQQKLEEYGRRPGRQPFEACLTADAIEGYFANQHGLDYRDEHIRTADFPLTFGRESLKTAIPNTIWDFHQTVWRPLTQQRQVATYGNANGYEQAFTAPFVDIMMFELFRQREPAGRWDRFVRAMARGKICRSCYFRDETVEEHFQRRLAYAIFPSVYTVGEALESGRALYRQYVPALESLSAAGWAPVPYARSGNVDIVVERFGDYRSHNLHLTLRNYAAEARPTLLTLDLDGLGIPADQADRLIACDLLRGFGQPESVSSKDWRVEVPADGSRAFWFGDPEGLARHALRLTEQGLRRVERLFAADLTETNRTSLGGAKERAAAAAAAEDPASLLAAAEDLQTRLDRIEPAIATSAHVDRAKVFGRIRSELSAAALGLLGLRLQSPRVVEGARGATTTASATLTNHGRQALSELHLSVLSPWPGAADASVIQDPPSQLPPGGQETFRVSLSAPAAPERELLPFLLRCQGRARGEPFTVQVQVDLVFSKQSRASG